MQRIPQSNVSRCIECNLGYVLFFTVYKVVSLPSAILTGAPQIRSSSGCVKNADRVSCSCEAEGFPAPSLLWYLDGLPVNHSDEFAISHESLSDTGVRSIITANQPQERNHSTLVCRTTNSQGTTSQRFYVLNPDCQKSSECRGLIFMKFLQIHLVEENRDLGLEF